MKKLVAMALIAGTLGLVGCEKKSGTAPSTDPNKPSATRKLTVTVSGSHTITQGGTDDVTINVNRDNFKDPVVIDVKDLPPGVTLASKDLTIAADKNTIVITLAAAADAKPTTDAVFHINAKSGDIKADELSVKLTVKAK